MIKTSIPSSSDHIYGNCDYLFYSTYVEDELYLDGKYARTIYCISGTLKVGHFILKAGDSIDVVNRQFLAHGKAHVYIAQVAVDPGTFQSTKITRAGAHYKVTKPWGWELWINGQSQFYSVKKIFIAAGNKTSLQYHNFKEESNLIEHGEVVLVYKHNTEVENDAVTPADLGAHTMHGPVCIHVTPKTIHRLIAKTDLYLFEVSTPFLDDVVRLHDDQQRPNGRIDSEHA